MSYTNIFLRGVRQYAPLINENKAKYPRFNGIMCKKLLFEQMRIVTEMMAWIEEFIDILPISSAVEWLQYAKEYCTGYSIEINNAVQYYRYHQLLYPSEEKSLTNYHRNLRRFKKRLQKRLRKVYV